MRDPVPMLLVAVALPFDMARALFSVVAHDPRPGALRHRVRGFMQARNWSRALTSAGLA